MGLVGGGVVLWSGVFGGGELNLCGWLVALTRCKRVASPPQWFFGFSSCRGASRLAAGGRHRSARAPGAMSPRSRRVGRAGRHSTRSARLFRPRLRISVNTDSQKFGAFAAVAQPYPQHMLFVRPRPLQPLILIGAPRPGRV